jgi:hypothetical protein
VQASLPIDHQPTGQRAGPPHAPPHPPQHIRRLLGEDQRPRAEPRVAQHANDHVPLARLAIADRDLPLGLPQIELQHIARAVHRALKRPLISEEQAHPAHVVIHDRLAALEPLLSQQLPDPLALDLRILTQQPVNLVLEPIELRPPRRARVARRRRRPQRPPDRLPMKPRPPTDLPNRQPLDEPHPTNLGPLLHVDHPSSPDPIDNDRARVKTHPDST